MDVTLITWEALGTPAQLGAVVAIITLLFTYPMIALAFDTFWYLPEDAIERRVLLRERWRKMAVILSICLLAFLLSAWRLEGEMRGVFVLTLTSVVMAIAQFEVIEKLVGVIFKTDLQDMNFLSLARNLN